jgi:colanic acid/amylovoran biosynthesis protein
MSAPRVLIINAVAQNGGDAAILFALMAQVRAIYGQDTEFVVVDDHWREVAELFPQLTVRSRLDQTFAPRRFLRRFGRAGEQARRLRILAGALAVRCHLGAVARLWLRGTQMAALDEYRRADAVLSTGGTYLVERYQIAGRLLEMEAALVMRRPLILFTQSVGAFLEERTRRDLRRVLARARLVLLRDERSLAHLRAIGLSGANMRVVADGVFGLEPRGGTTPGEVRRIVVSVRDWAYATDGESSNAAYRQGIATMVQELVTTLGAEVSFISTCQGTPGYKIDDSQVAAQIAELLPDEVRASVTVDRSFHAPEDLLQILSESDLVVATRMHMAILSLIAGTPVFPIAYEFKTRELFARLGLERWVYDFEQVATPAFAPDVVRFIHDLPQITDGLWPAVAREHRSAQDGQAMIAQSLAVNRR